MGARQRPTSNGAGARTQEAGIELLVHSRGGAAANRQTTKQIAKLATTRNKACGTSILVDQFSFGRAISVRSMEKRSVYEPGRSAAMNECSSGPEESNIQMSNELFPLRVHRSRSPPFPLKGIGRFVGGNGPLPLRLAPGCRSTLQSFSSSSLKIV